MDWNRELSNVRSVKRALEQPGDLFAAGKGNTKGAKNLSWSFLCVLIENGS